MKRILKSFIALALILASCKLSAQDNTLYDTSSVPQLVSRQFGFTEGASVDSYGNVFFTDQPNNRIWEYDIHAKLSIFLDSAGRSNGMYFDHDGNLVSCADENDQLWSISPAKKVKVLLTDYKGQLMNGPNDIWIDAKGGIYMTDPYYQRPYWTRSAPAINWQYVYYLPKGKKQPFLVDSTLKQPNGIVGTPDGRYLYVADIAGNKIYKFVIDKDGSLSGRKVFLQQGADGITLDERGNIYLCGKGITVYDPAGNEIAHININEPWTSNLCFGGADKRTLFITASKAVYVMRMKVKGVE